MDIRTYRLNEVIFRQGEPGDCMYDLQFGKVGIFIDYGGPNQKKIAELMTDQFFGEMGLLDHAPRSATAVSLAPDTVVDVITEDGFYDLFEKNPSKVLLLMQQMCARLRRTTKDYVEACRTVHDTVETEKAGVKKSESLKDRIKKFHEQYVGFNYQAHS